MFLANNVIHLTTKVSILFANQAVLAQTFGACLNQSS